MGQERRLETLQRPRPSHQVLAEMASTYIGAVKPNLDHSESFPRPDCCPEGNVGPAASDYPSNIKYSLLNPRIQFESAKLQIPTGPTAWPVTGASELVSIPLVVGGSDTHVILESAGQFLPAHQVG
jgi:hypothetical protein